MQALSILDRYIGKIIFVSIMMILFILVSISSIIKFVDQLKKTGQGNYNIFDACLYTVLIIPKDIYIFFPMAALIGTLLGLGILSQRNELVVMQASGYTSIQIALSVMKTAIPLIFLTIVIGELLAPQSEQMARNYRALAIYGSSLISTHQHGLWAKDNQSFIYIEHVKSNDELSGISIFNFNKNHRLESLRYSTTAKFDPKHKLWFLSQVRESNLQDPKQINSTQWVCNTWKTNLTPDKIGVFAFNPDALSIGGLHKYVKYLKSSGQDYYRYQHKMWSKIFQPISLLVMMFMALSFIFGPLHHTQMSIRIVIGIISGFIFYLLDQIFVFLTPFYSVPPILGAILPSLSFLLVSLWLVLKHF